LRIYTQKYTASFGSQDRKQKLSIYDKKNKTQLKNYHFNLPDKQATNSLFTIHVQKYI